MDVLEGVKNIDKNMLKNCSAGTFPESNSFDKLYLPLHQINIIPELGSTLWCCIEALSELVKTAEDK
jgi:hypothetical protein